MEMDGRKVLYVIFKINVEETGKTTKNPSPSRHIPTLLITKQECRKLQNNHSHLEMLIVPETVKKFRNIIIPFTRSQHASVY